MATPTTETEIWLALKAQLDTMTLPAGAGWMLPGQNATIPQGIGLEVEFMPNRPRRRYLDGDAPSFRQGILQVGVLVKAGSTNPAYPQELSGDIADHFPVDEPLRYGGVTVKVYEAPQVGGGFYDTARQRFITPVTIRWQTEA